VQLWPQVPYEGTAKQVRAGLTALRVVARRDDLELLELLLRHGYPVDPAVSGTSGVLALAMADRSHRVVERLLACGKPVGDAVIVYAYGITRELARALIDAGTRFDVEAVLSAAGDGDLEAAVHIASTGRREGDWGQLSKLIKERAKAEKQSACEIESGKLSSSTSAAEYRERARRLQNLDKRLSPRR